MRLKHENGDRLYKTFIYLVLGILAVLILVPVVWVMVASIKATPEHYGSTWLVSGLWLERIIQNINFDDYESRNHFDQLLRKNGVFQRLEEMGIQDGDTVDIYDFEFEYQR